MFGGMGMFGAFGYDPEEVAKKNEEMKREAEARRKFEENLDKPITITKRQFMELSATVVAQGGFMDKAVEHNPKMGFVLMLAVTPVISELTHELFDKDQTVKEEEK